MFERLQKKWKVKGAQLVLILCTFAIGGSLTGYVGRKLMNLLPLEKGVAWVAVYIIVVTVLWPFAVLLVSFPFGQFRFFWSYLGKMGRRMGLIKSAGATKNPNIRRVAIFASGAGSNAQKIINFFKKDPAVRIILIVCNKPGAGVLNIAREEQIPSLLIEKDRFFQGDAYLPELKAAGVDFIVLAGFLWKVPSPLIEAYPNQMVNIHPALLPNYGGKGMYGRHVHAAVIAAGDKESGISIHYVDGKYDHGAVIFQARCPVLPTDTADTLAERIHALEHEHYPAVLSRLLKP